LLLIGWAEVGPDLLRALTVAGRPNGATSDHVKRMDAPFTNESPATAPEPCRENTTPHDIPPEGQSSLAASSMVDNYLLERAREADARRWDECSPTDLRGHTSQKLRIGAGRSRLLVAITVATRNNDQLQTRWQHRSEREVR
jgi:hypothetical protein